MSDKASPSFKEAFPGLVLIGLIAWGGWFLFLRADPATPAAESASAPVSAEFAAPEPHAVAVRTNDIEQPSVPAIVDRADLVFSVTDDHNTRLVDTATDDRIAVIIGDSQPDVTGYLLCPDPLTLEEARFAMNRGDPSHLDFVSRGNGCFIAAAGWGYVVAVHRLNFVKIRFLGLAGNHYDTGEYVEDESEEQVYWAASYQVGTLDGNSRLEPLIHAAFE